MALEITKNINVDVYDDKYILLNAKQYDNSSRYITVTCYDQGKILNLNSSKHTAYVRYKKPDEHIVFNFCTINPRGQIEVELTEQMLADTGVCDVDLVIVNKGSAVINIDNGDIINIDSSSVISTMAFRIYVYESSVDNSLIESSDEFNGLTELMEMATAEYDEVIKASKHWSSMSQSWAIGESGVEGRKEVEDTDNSKYYSIQSSISADKAKESETNAKASEDAAKLSETNAKASEDAAKLSETNAKTSEDKAFESEQKSKASEDKAFESEQKSKASEDKALVSETNAKASEEAAKLSETNAKTSEENAMMSETNAKTSENNARDYCETVKSVVDGLNSGFIPIGTISFSELANAEKATGFTYNINDDFITDETFREGAGKSYTAGTNVYYTADNYWDCFGGSVSPTATIDEVKEYLGI